MAFRSQLVAGWGLLLGSTGALAADPIPVAAEPAPAASSPRPFHLGPKAKEEANKGGPEVENVLKALEALTPEQREKFQENFVRWVNLSPDEKKSLRERDEARKKKMVEETETAIQQSGLNLNPGQRAKYAKRFAEERRKIEEKLREESEAKRKPLVEQLVTQLRLEFSGEVRLSHPRSRQSPVKPAGGLRQRWPKDGRPLILETASESTNDLPHRSPNQTTRTPPASRSCLSFPNSVLGNAMGSGTLFRRRGVPRRSRAASLLPEERPRRNGASSREN